ncbi:hypothetical protein CFP56_039679 [Quercus suber]|uniref:Uncharacterized protein n=1 Tax=Quercus suber TaxID=58331 RepID=A0AAW0MBQ0_QUESU
MDLLKSSFLDGFDQLKNTVGSVCDCCCRWLRAYEGLSCLFQRVKLRLIFPVRTSGLSSYGKNWPVLCNHKSLGKFWLVDCKLFLVCNVRVAITQKLELAVVPGKLWLLDWKLVLVCYV